MKKVLLLTVAFFSANAFSADDRSEINGLLRAGIASYELCASSVEIAMMPDSGTTVESLCEIPIENGKEKFKKANELNKKQPKAIREKINLLLKKGMVALNTYAPNATESKYEYRRRLASNINALKEMKAEIDLEL